MSELKKLSDFSIGDRMKVVKYEKVEKVYREKLLSMGLTKGTEVKFIGTAPLGDPVELEVRGFKLSLRKNEADALLFEKVG